MAIAHVQSRGTNNTASGTTLSLAYSSDVTANNLLIAAVGLQGTNLTGLAVSDNVDGSWTQLKTESSPSGLMNYSAAIFYKKASSSGPRTVTLTTPSTGFRDLGILEYSGVDTADKSASNHDLSQSTSPSSGSATTTVAAELLFGWILTFNGDALTAGSGWTKRLAFASQNTMEQIVSSTGSYQANGTIANDHWIAMMGTFYAGTSGDATVTAVLMDGTGGIAAPVMGADAAITSPALSGTGGIAAPIVVGGTGATVAAPALAATGDVAAAALAADSAVTGVPMSGAGDVANPAVQGGTGAGVTGISLAGTGDVAAPQIGADADVSAAQLGGTGDVAGATISSGSDFNVNAVPLQGAGAIVAAAIFADATLGPGPLAGLGALLPAIVSAGTAGNVNAVPLAGVGDIAAPVLSAGVLLAAVALAGTGDVATPNLSLGQTVAGVVLEGFGSIAIAAVSGTSAGQVTALPMGGSGNIAAPTLAAGVTLIAAGLAATGDINGDAAGHNDRIVVAQLLAATGMLAASVGGGATVTASLLDATGSLMLAIARGDSFHRHPRPPLLRSETGPLHRVPAPPIRR